MILPDIRESESGTSYFVRSDFLILEGTKYVDDILDSIKIQPVRDAIIRGEVFLAGGYIRDFLLTKKPNDIDIYPRDKRQFGKIAATLRDSVSGGTINARGCSHKFHCHATDTTVDVICCHDTVGVNPILLMDFTCCMFSISGGTMYRHHSADLDLRCRELKYVPSDKSKSAVKSILRLNKFLKNGFTIEDSEIMKILSCIPQDYNFSLTPLEHGQY